MPTMAAVTLPGATKQDLAEIQEAVKGVEGIENAGSTDTRSIDPASIGMYLQLGSAVVGAISTALPVMQKVAGIIRGKGIKGAKIKFPDGSVLALDQISARDLEKVLKATKRT